MREFKHDVNKVIEGCAEALEKKMTFNPMQVLRKFELFGMNFFENTPIVPENEIEDWYYLRDKNTHAAVIYNHESGEIQLVEPEKYWVEETKEEFRLNEEKLQESFREKLKVINETKRSDYYRIVKPLLKWFYECPLPWVTTHFWGYNPSKYVSSLIEYNPEWFKLKKDEEFENITDKIMDAYYYDGLPREGNVDYIDPSINLHKKDGKVYLDTATKFRTPTDVLEFLIKHTDKKIAVNYDEDAYYKYNIDVYY
jgi:hypothetical protein